MKVSYFQNQTFKFWTGVVVFSFVQTFLVITFIQPASENFTNNLNSQQHCYEISQENSPELPTLPLSKREYKEGLGFSYHLPPPKRLPELKINKTPYKKMALKKSSSKVSKNFQKSIAQKQITKTVQSPVQKNYYHAPDYKKQTAVISNEIIQTSSQFTAWNRRPSGEERNLPRTFAEQVQNPKINQLPTGYKIKEGDASSPKSIEIGDKFNF